MLWKRLEESCPGDLASTEGRTQDLQVVEYCVVGGQTVDEGPWTVGMSFTEEAVSLLSRGKVNTKISVHLAFRPHTSVRAPTTYVMDAGGGWLAHEVVSSVPMASFTGNDSVLELASRWLEERSSDHEDCLNDELDGWWMPMRLIEIKSVSDSGYCFRSVSPPSDMVPAQRYLTLSYRWGRSDCLRLTKSTLFALSSWTDAQALPKTLRDALVVCSYLKSSYIWIDRLCIIQDDPQDWMSQAAQMGKIYARAFCNLAADASENDNGVLFRDRNPPDLALLHYYRKGRLGRIVNSALLDSSLWDSRVTTAPLNQRAWVLRERFLSRRTLHFSKDQLLWACRGMTATETFRKGLQLDGVTKRIGLFQYPRYWAPEWQEKSCVNRCSICCSWYGDLVSPFTSASITYADDRPLAFEGIGKMVSESIKDTYVAGMLLGHLRKQLLWAAIQLPDSQAGLPTAAQKQSGREFPSFSWLSLDCGIRHIGYNFRPEKPYLYEVRKVDVGPLALVDGQLRQTGRLQLHGFLIPIRLTHVVDRAGNDSWNLEKPSSEFRTDFAASAARCWEENEGSPFLPFMYPDWTRRSLPLSSRAAEHRLMLAAFEVWTVHFLILEESDLEKGTDISLRR
ncbi:hypothetical protein LTR78_000557 [Recurvomyces mirabilis]|uniref:Heterokaryon incompatibility domain-containing protein n=1 Tax=Recurvomyces mirabilis TaxID=574656 RepID=A0AAE1C6K1_9PEZI|nr:hypothetical protein LTR78_000557 [Recurvomyces mirabilis]KAK5162211.1 hypothetical protein LTS14_000557 [Recurvomyces mirabilis]